MRLTSLITLTSIITLIGCGSSGGGEEKSRTSNSSPPSKRWYEAGTLHNATVLQWKDATYQNQLATAADWLTATKWRGYLNSPADLSKMKVKAQMLVDAVDEAVAVENTETLHVNEIAAVIVTMSNDLGP